MPATYIRASLAKGRNFDKMALTVAAGNTVKQGMLLIITAGEWVIAAGNANEKIAAIALSDAAAGTVLIAGKITSSTKLRMSVYHVTPATAVTATAKIGTPTQMILIATKHCIDVANMGAAAEAIINIEEVDGMYAVGTQYGAYICSVINDHLQFAS